MTIKNSSLLTRGLSVLLAVLLLLSTNSINIFADGGEPNFAPDANYQVSVSIKQPDEGYWSSIGNHINSEANIATDENAVPTVELKMMQGYDDDYNPRWITELTIFQQDGVTPIEDLSYTPQHIEDGWSIIKGVVTFILPYVDESGVYTGKATLSDDTVCDIVLTFNWRYLEQVLPAAEAPTIEPCGGEFSDSIEVAIKSSLSDATILYTTDGSTPSYSEYGNNGTLYTAPFTVTKTTVVKAIAYKPGVYRESAVSSAKFQKTTMPELIPGQEYYVYISPEDPAYELAAYLGASAVAEIQQDGSVILNITCIDDWYGATLSGFTMHKTEGSTDSEDLMEIPIAPASGSYGYHSVTGTMAVKLPYIGMTSVYSGTFEISDGTKGSYTMTIDWDNIEPKLKSVSTPIISPEQGNISKETEITISCDTEGAKIYYTLDGSEPDFNSTEYTEPFTINSSVTVKAKAYKDGMDASKTATAVYHWNLLGDIIKAEYISGEKYDTLKLISLDSSYWKNVGSSGYSSTEYYLR